MGVLGLDYAVDLGKKQDVPAKKITGLKAITSDNVDAADVKPYIYKSC
jgi:hypothetical protein